MSTGMIIDGVLGSEAIDSSGEILDVAGADISDVEKGTLLLNWEHEPGEKGADTIVGVVVAAKKIYSEADCENDRQKKYWKEVQLPFIYGVMRLYDGAGHENAKAIAAIIRDHVANDEMVVCRFSVEGSTLSKEDNRLKESVIRRVAVTVKPCNRTANSGLIEDPMAPEGFEKKHTKEKLTDLLDMAGDTAKNEMEFPLYARLGRSSDIACNPVVEEGLYKAYEAGVTSGAPGTLTGGAALQREHLGSMGDRARILALKHRDREDFDKAEFRAMAKQMLPEASDDFIDHFVDLVDDYRVKRSHLTKNQGFDLPYLHSLEIALKMVQKSLKKNTELSGVQLSNPMAPTVYAIYLKTNGYEHRAGRFMVDRTNHLHHLEDYYGILAHFLPEGLMSGKTLAMINELSKAPSLKVVVEHASDKKQEEPEGTSIFKEPEPPATRPPSVFEYHRAGMDKPHTLEYHSGKILLDGQPLDDNEAKTILANVKTSAATLRYKKSAVSIANQVQKMEQSFLELLKAERQPAQDIMAHIRDLEARGLVKPGTSNDLTSHLFEDPGMEGIGNKKAFEEFQAKNKPGAHFAGDFNDFSAVNNAWGHKVGDEAIGAYGHAMRAAMDESGAQGKLFRTGGDEVSGWFPSHEHAMKFTRALHGKLEAVPPVQGVHKLSMTMGIGPTPEHADKASYMAKELKYHPGQDAVPMRDRSRVFKVGTAPNFAHSLMPGSEGPVPLVSPGAAAVHDTLKTPKSVATPAPVAA